MRREREGVEGLRAVQLHAEQPGEPVVDTGWEAGARGASGISLLGPLVAGTRAASTGRRGQVPPGAEVAADECWRCGGGSHVSRSRQTACAGCCTGSSCSSSCSAAGAASRRAGATAAGRAAGEGPQPAPAAKPPQAAEAAKAPVKQPAPATGAAREAANAAQQARPRPTTAAALETSKRTFTGASGSPKPLHSDVQNKLHHILRLYDLLFMVVALEPQCISKGLWRLVLIRLVVQ